MKLRFRWEKVLEVIEGVTSVAFGTKFLMFVFLRPQMELSRHQGRYFVTWTEETYQKSLKTGMTRALNLSLSPSANQKVIFLVSVSTWNFKEVIFWGLFFFQWQILILISEIPQKSSLNLTGDFHLHLCAEKGHPTNQLGH